MKLVLLLYLTTAIGCTYGHPGAHAGNFMASSPCFSFQGQNIIWPAGGGGIGGMSCPWSNCFNHPFFSGGGSMGGFPGMPSPPKPCGKPCGEPIEASSPSEPEHPSTPAAAAVHDAATAASVSVAIPEPVLADVPKVPDVHALPVQPHAPEAVAASPSTVHPIQEASASSAEVHATPAVAVSPAVISAPTNEIPTPVGIAVSSNAAVHPTDAIAAPSVVDHVSAPSVATHVSVPEAVPAPNVIPVQEASASAAPTDDSSTAAHIPAHGIVAAPANEIPASAAVHSPADITAVVSPIASAPVHADATPIAAAVPVPSAETSVPTPVNHDVLPSAAHHETVAPTLIPETSAPVLSAGISTPGISDSLNAVHASAVKHEEASASHPADAIAHPVATDAAVAASTPVVPAPVVHEQTAVVHPSVSSLKVEEASASNEAEPSSASAPLPTCPSITDTCNITCPFPSLIDPLPCPIPYSDISPFPFSPFIDACNFTDLTSSLKAPIIDNCNLNYNISDHVHPFICPDSWNAGNCPGLVPIDDCAIRPYEHDVGCPPNHPYNFINPHCAYDDAVHHHCPIGYPLYGDLPGCDTKILSHIPSLNISDLSGCNFTDIEQKPLIENFPIYNHHVCDKHACEIGHHADHIPVDEPCMNHLPVSHQYIRPVVGSAVPHVPFMDAHVRENIPAYDDLACGVHGVHFDGLPSGGPFVESHPYNPEQGIPTENPSTCPISIPNTASNFCAGPTEGAPSCNHAPELEQTIENFRKNLYLPPSAKHLCPHEEASSPGAPEEFAVNRGEDLGPLGRDIQPGECVGPCRNFLDEGSASSAGDYYAPGPGPHGPVEEPQPGPGSPALENAIPFPQENVGDVSESDGSAGFTRHPDYCE